MPLQLLNYTSLNLQKIIDQCSQDKITLIEARTEIINVMNTIFNQCQDSIRGDYMNEIYIQTTKVLS